MKTFLDDFVVKLEEQWNEIETLIVEADKLQNNQEKDLYNALCRSIIVLRVAHMEGFLKDLIRNTINDLNNNLKFSDLPNKIKYTFSSFFLDNENHYKQNKLISIFEESDVKINYDAFLFNNKNPKEDTIEKAFSSFGIKNVFKAIHNAEIELVFSDTSVGKTMLDDIAQHVKAGISSYPYNINMHNYAFCNDDSKGKTLWEEFIEQINMKRHEVVHGNNFENSVDIGTLKSDNIKIRLLQMCLICALCQNIILKSSTCNL